MRIQFDWRAQWLRGAALGGLALLGGCVGHLSDEPPAKPAPAPIRSAQAEPAEARAILQRMARYLAGTPRFSVHVMASYDAVQPWGQQIEFGENISIDVSRPKGLRVESVGSNGRRHQLFYDGQTLTTFSPTENVYAQAAKPGDIDTAIGYFLTDLQMRLPLAALLLRRFPEEIGTRSQVVDYVEKTELYGAPAHHLSGRTETLDYEVWIAEGAQPLPQRIVLTYREAAGQPAFRAQFSDWNLTPQAPVDFTFTPPAGARKIAFAAQLPRAAQQPGGQP